MATITGTNRNETISGTAGDDLIDARGGNDTVNALRGTDQVRGGTGNDSIFGGTGVDGLDGEEDGDYVQGGANNDELFGGFGADVDRLRGGVGGDDEFFYSTSGVGHDRILDFGEGGNTLAEPRADPGTTGDFVSLIDVTTEQIRALYGEEITDADPGVSFIDANEGLPGVNDMVIDFSVGPTPPFGDGVLTLVDTFNVLGPGGLDVGTDIIGSA
jgi:Ca2+-binding RTX toxin-like protein